jgi:hypothetical protein
MSVEALRAYIIRLSTPGHPKPLHSMTVLLFASSNSRLVVPSKSRMRIFEVAGESLNIRFLTIGTCFFAETIWANGQRIDRSKTDSSVATEDQSYLSVEFVVELSIEDVFLANRQLLRRMVP